MGSNLLQAIVNIAARDQFLLSHKAQTRNRINRVGESLEVYVQQAFANVFDSQTAIEFTQQTQDIFSYVSNNSSPPDLILRDGDAVEVKKLESINGTISLNSSYPKSHLHADSSLLTQACKNCETKRWQIKDHIYVIGFVPKVGKALKTLKQLWFVDGACYAASRDVYEQPFTRISDSLHKAENVTFDEKSTELGRAIKVDPLERTILRVRGMWEIQHPNKAFRDLIGQQSTENFQMLAVVRESKYQQILNSDQNLETTIERLGIQVTTAQVLDPNNKAKLLNVRVVQYEANHG